jgi:hypothetical protein
MIIQAHEGVTGITYAKNKDKRMYGRKLSIGSQKRGKEG